MSAQPDSPSPSPALPATPDFDAWPVDVAIAAVDHDAHTLTVIWEDGRRSRYHSIWLRENAADDSTVNPATRERILDLSRLEAWPTLEQARLEANGAVTLAFLPEQRQLSFHPGWLRAHDYANLVEHEPALVPRTLWRGVDRDAPITLDAAGSSVAADQSPRPDFPLENEAVYNIAHSSSFALGTQYFNRTEYYPLEVNTYAGQCIDPPSNQIVKTVNSKLFSVVAISCFISSNEINKNPLKYGSILKNS